MIFLGDIAIPGIKVFDENSVEAISELFTGQAVVGNLEGAICKDCDQYFNNRVLFNSESALNIFKRWNIKAMNLANNHIFDIPDSLSYTQKKLTECGIASFGAGKNLKKASEPVKLLIEGREVVFLGFGWEAIQCQPATASTEGVNPLEYKHVLDCVKKTRAKYPDARLIIVMHWNYELEYYPQPAERQLARKCIDLGVDAVLGGHSHLVQGIEIYKNIPIVYSLGNWAFPHGIFFSKKIAFPEITTLQLALEWDFDSDPICHWFSYNPITHQIVYLNSESLMRSERIKRLTPFEGMDRNIYSNWFRTHRNKNKLLPIFKDINSKKLNRMKIEFIKGRGHILDMLANKGWKKIKNE